MKLAHFCIDRPIFATVLSVLTIIVGLVSYFALPVTQYPEVAPPTIQVTASYPGASAETIARTVATPLEQELNGVDGMLYMFSQSTQDGRLTITVTFELGTDLDTAQVLVQNRVAIAEPRLPQAVQRLGVTTRKNSPDFLMVVHLYSPEGLYDQVYLANYATLRLRDELLRVGGIGQVQIFGASDYSMRIWLDPDKLTSLDLTASEVLDALRAQNIQVAGGFINQPPVPSQTAFELSIQTLGRLDEAVEFENVIVKRGRNERVVRLRDVARVELGAESYTTRAYLDEAPAIAMLLFQRPGSNALDTADEVFELLDAQAEQFPPGLAYDVIYNPTEFVAESVDAVYNTIFEATALVVLVILIFLQSLRTAIIPIVAIPVSLIGTFAVMSAFGFSLNTLSLFGLVLAIGIVVDDAIVVVENVERKISEGLAPREAAHATMDEVGGALIATSLVLIAVFVPTAFLGGISGQFYKQFALTIAVSTVISTIVSLTLSPALSALFLKAHNPDRPTPLYARPGRAFANLFNRLFARLELAYAGVTARLLRMTFLVGIVYAGLIGLTWYQFDRTPGGFIPAQDQGYVIIASQLPPGAALERTDNMVRAAIPEILAIDGIESIAAFTGFSGATSTNATNSATMFPVLADFETRAASGRSVHAVIGDIYAVMGKYDEAFTVVIEPPPVRGIGTGGGFKMMVQDRGGYGLETLKSVTDDFAARANQDPALSRVFSFFNTGTPQLYLDINRTKAEQLGVPVSEVFEALEVFLGSEFVNDFNFLSRTYRVTAQADAPYRLTEDDILRLHARSDNGTMVPLGTVASLEHITGPSRVPRYNLYDAAALQGSTAPGFSSDQALTAMERLADDVLPAQMGFEWTEIAYQERQAGNTAAIAFALAVLFVFLILAAQYESWSMPMAVVLIVPMVLLCAITGVGWRGMENDIMVQIAFVVLVGLACKNAILIVEFARQLEDRGMTTVRATIEAARLRLRPILMTSFAFILGVVPLVIATGAGAEMRQALGTAVFSGMLGVTFFGLLLTPVFYLITRGRLRARADEAAAVAAPAE